MFWTVMRRARRETGQRLRRLTQREHGAIPWRSLANPASPSLNPQNKPPDLISFDVFADDSDLNALSQEAPTTSANTSAPGAAPTSSIGLPLDLFSSPAPQDLFSAPQQQQQGTSKPRQDPMAFFNVPQTSQPSFQQLPPQGTHQTSSMFGTFASASGTTVSGSSTPSSNPGFGAGISLPITHAVTPPGNITTQNTNASNSQGKARDPFADLANW